MSEIKYLPTIGLEIHVELKTKTKMFCDSLNDPDEKHPNLNICPVCTGQPGTLPTINQEAINKLIKVGLALNCQVAEFSKFDRKNYFYPDLPKGYQISQFDLPLCRDGYLEANDKRIGIERIHMEEDTGRLLHPDKGNYTLVDFNRAGIPLMELVTKPDLNSGKDIEEFAKELQLILRYLNASNADMEKGQMRVEVNVSVRDKKPRTASPRGKQEARGKLGTKVEIKNINSIKAASAAADYEIERQSEFLEKGGVIKQETRGWDENKGETFSQRTKEGSADYRYFPEPDLPPMVFTEEQIENYRTSLPELPAQRRKRFKEEFGLNDSQIEIFTVAKHFGDYYENVVSELDQTEGDLQKLHSLAANYIITEFPPLFNMTGLEIDDMEALKITPEAFAELIVMIFREKLSSTGAKIVLKEMAETGLHPEQIVKEKNLSQTSDIEEIGRAIDEVVAKNPKAVEDYKKGKIETIKFLTGQVMALTRGKANPQIVSQLLEQKLK
jgi:aspartyl-tRNA(Asn)/glutamyl-tRNA(Gln) amidotransferase subunit B